MRRDAGPLSDEPERWHDPGDGAPGKQALRLRGPAELVEAMPYLLGFRPAESLVAVGLRHGVLVGTARVDLADAAAGPGPLATVATALCRAGTREVVLAVWSEPPADPEALDRPPHEALAALAASMLDAAGLRVTARLLVMGDRFWSYAGDPVDWLSDGLPFTASGRVAAEATFAGMATRGDRETLERSLDPQSDRAVLLPELAAEQRRAVARVLAGEGERARRAVIRQLFAAARSSDVSAASALSAQQVVSFGVALDDLAVRDAVWLAVDDGRLDGRRLWQQLGCRLPSPFDVPALFLLGWASWRAGDGILAGMATDRAVASDPGYTAVDQLRTLVAHGVAPQTFPRLRSGRAIRSARRADVPAPAGRWSR